MVLIFIEKKSNNHLENHRFFPETRWFYEVFEILGLKNGSSFDSSAFVWAFILVISMPLGITPTLIPSLTHFIMAKFGKYTRY